MEHDRRAQSSGAKQAGGMSSEQCLITKALGEATGMTQLKMRV